MCSLTTFHMTICPSNECGEGMRTKRGSSNSAEKVHSCFDSCTDFPCRVNMSLTFSEFSLVCMHTQQLNTLFYPSAMPLEQCYVLAEMRHSARPILFTVAWALWFIRLSCQLMQGSLGLQIESLYNLCNLS